MQLLKQFYCARKLRHKLPQFIAVCVMDLRALELLQQGQKRSPTVGAADSLETLGGVYSDTTQLNSTSSCRHVHSVNNCHLSMNVVTQLSQFVGRDVINKNTTDLAVRCSTGSVEFS